MGRRVVWLLAGMVLVFALGVGSAGGHTLATTTVVVDVIGKGRVTSSPDGIKCGNNRTACFTAFTVAVGSVTLTAVPADGWSDGTWSGDDCMGTTAVPCSVPLDGMPHWNTASFTTSSGTSTRTLSVSYNDPTTGGDGNVSGPEQTPPGSEIDCGIGTSGNCSWTVLEGSVLTIFETPINPSIFRGWSGDCTGTDVSCTVEMDGDRSVNAAWDEPTAATNDLTVTISGNGTVKGGNVDCTGPSVCHATEPLNETVGLIATPQPGYVFTGWTGACTGTSGSCTVTMDVDRAVTATFTIAVTLTTNVSGNGNVSGGAGAINCGNGANVCSASFALNTTITLIATPATGATFVGWTGACGGSATTCTILMSATKDVTAQFTGGAVPGATTFALSVSVNGNGLVTGGGIRCGDGSIVCTANQTANASVTLTATPDTGATFAGWGGACTGTSICTVTMTAARSVSATFTGGTTPPPTTQVTLTVTVTGKGTVRGGVIACGNGQISCSASLSPNSSVVLTATAATGATFTGWGGACTGTAKTCTVSLATSRSVTATFTGGTTTGGGGTTAPGALTSLALPLVRKTAGGYVVTLRFKTLLAGTARVRGFRAGRVVTALALHVSAGNTTVGPFRVKLSGFYIFEVKVGSRSLRWRTCLGLCGRAATAAPFVLTRGTPIVTRTGVVWQLTLRYRASAISDANVTVKRGTRLLSTHHFLAGARAIIVGPFLLGAGSYTLKLRAVDAYGRVRTLTWIVDLAR